MAKAASLSVEDEAIVVAFRRHTLLPLDDCLYALQPTLPHLTRSSLHRCLQRRDISRLPDVQGEKPDKRKFKAYPFGYIHIDIDEVHTGQGRLYLLVAIDRSSKFAFIKLHENATRRVAAGFLRALISGPCPTGFISCRPTTASTSPRQAIAPRPPPGIRLAIDCGELVWAPAFEYACAENHIDHRLTKPRPGSLPVSRA